MSAPKISKKFCGCMDSLAVILHLTPSKGGEFEPLSLKLKKKSPKIPQ